MFNGVVNPFIGTATSSQHHLFDHVLSSSFPPPHDHYHQLLHVMTNQSSSSFYDYDDPFNHTGRSQVVQSTSNNNNFSSSIDNTSSALQRERSTTTNDNSINNYNHHRPWSSDEVVALLKVRSRLENWFPDFTWEHVSRKLAELGYKRSADQWKQKYEEEEEENKQFNQVYPNDHLEPGISRKAVEVKQKEQLLVQHKDNVFVEENPTDAEANREVSEEVVKESSNNKRKMRRREEGDTFETLKRCCEVVVNKMIAHQEQLHKKLVEDIVKRDEEDIARDEAWKNQEMAKIREEIETRAKEQVHAEKRKAMIIEFLNKFTSPCHDDDDNGRDQFLTPQEKVEENPNSSPTDQNNHKATLEEDPRTSLSESEAMMIFETTSPNEEKGSVDTGKKRWPRDEVLALINLRCKMSSNNSDHIVGGKGHLWERISRGMMEMGYKRSAKRCKEKWENINKYFRRTRDGNKKRSMDSRTCPYFHQLSSLYSEGTVFLVAPTKY